MISTISLEKGKEYIKEPQNAESCQHSLTNTRLDNVIKPLHPSLSRSVQNYNNHIHSTIVSLRGGGETDINVGNESEKKSLLGLIDKIQTYKQKVKQNMLFEKEFEYYVEPKAKIIPSLAERFDDTDENIRELAIDMQKRFLNQDSRARLLLLTGEAGIGKTLFCRYLLKNLLFEWQNENIDEMQWLPILIRPNARGEIHTIDITEAIVNELHLTENELKLLQNSHQIRGCPSVLLIFDDFDHTARRLNPNQREGQLLQNNFYKAQTTLETDWKNAKIIVCCREQSFPHGIKKEYLFGRIEDNSKRSLVPGTFLEYSIQPFSDRDIASFLKKYITMKFPVNLGESGQHGFHSQIRNSWDLVKEIEKIISFYNLKELAKIPNLLAMAVDVVIDMVGKGRLSIRESLPENVEEGKDQTVLKSEKADRLTSEINFDSESLNESDEDSDSSSNSSHTFGVEYNYLGPELGEDEIYLFSDPSESSRSSKNSDEEKEDEYSSSFDSEIEEQKENRSIENLDTIDQGQHEHKKEEAVNEIKWNYRSLCHSYIDLLLREKVNPHGVDSTEKSEINMKTDEIEKLLQSVGKCALSLDGYLLEEPENAEEKKKTIEMLLETSLLRKIECTEAHTDLEFSSNLLRDYLIAKVIEQEIIKFSHDEILADSQFMLLNQKFLKKQTVILRFLRESIEDKIIAVDDLLKLFDALRQKFHPKKCQAQDSYSLQQDGLFNKHNSEFYTIAAENIVVLLSAIEYGFSGVDLSYIQLPHLDLRQRTFNGANFRYANLEGADFTDGQLKNADFSYANLQGTQFGAQMNLSIKDRVLCMKFSSDGKKLAVCAETDILIFEMDEQSRFSEAQRLRGHIIEVMTCSFSLDGRKLISADNDGQVRIWEVETGTCIDEFKADTTSITRCAISSDGTKLLLGSYIISEMKPEFRVYSRSDTNHKAYLCIATIKNIISCEFSPDGKFIISKDIQGKVCSWSTKNNKCLLTLQDRIKKIDHRLHCCKLSPDKAQVVCQNFQGALVGDSVRGYFVKLVEYEEKEYSHRMSFLQCTEMKQVITTMTGNLLMQDFATGKIIQLLTGNEFCPKKVKKLGESGVSLALFLNFAITPDMEHVAILHKSNVISLMELSDSRTNRKIEPPNVTSCDFSGVKIDNSAGLSEENIRMFQKKGDYGKFDKDFLKFIVKNSDPKNLREIKFNNHRLSSVHVEIIGRNLNWSNLETIRLDQNKITDEAGIFIGSNKTWINLKVLNLSSNYIGDKTAEAIGYNSSWEKLECLFLNWNNIKDRGVLDISANTSWKNIRKINLGSNEFGDEGTEGLGQNTTWINLEELSLDRNRIGDIGAVAIASNTAWRNLIKLDLGFNVIRATGAVAIVMNTAWKKLEELYLDGNYIHDSKVMTLFATNKTWENVRVFDLQGNQIRYDINETLSLFTSDVTLKNLSRLCLPHVTFDEAVLRYFKRVSAEKVHEIVLPNRNYSCVLVAAIGFNNSWSNLTTLDLSGNKILDEGAKIIANTLAWTHLKELKLPNSQIGVQGAQAISNNKVWKFLTLLDLSRNNIQSQGASSIAKNSIWESLETLNLSSNNIDNEGAMNLGQNQVWTNLKTLDLSHNKIDSVGAEDLSKNASWTSLQTMNLENNRIGEARSFALSQNKSWKNLREIKLGNNTLDGPGANTIAKNPCWTKLELMELQGNMLGAIGMKTMSKNSELWENLKTLNLNKNWIGDEGVKYLVKITTLTKLTRLDLGYNSIGAEGTENISSNPVWAGLEVLSLASNKIGNGGAKHLGGNILWTHLKSLDLSENTIEDAGAMSLGNNNAWENLETLDLHGNLIKIKGMLQLSQARIWKKLQTLNVEGNPIFEMEPSKKKKKKHEIDNSEETKDATTEIDSFRNAGLMQTWRNLTTLNFAKTSIQVQTVIDMNSSEALSNLQTLNLERNKLNSRAARLLSYNQTWANLKTLNLAKAFTNDVKYLFNNRSWTSLTVLDLKENVIKHSEIEKLSQNPTWINLKVLDLSRCDLDSRAIRKLSQNETWRQLEILNLSANKAGDKGAEYLADNSSWVRLKTLQLAKNAITDFGAKKLSRNTSWSNLEKIDLTFNNVRVGGASELLRNKNWKNLLKLEF